MTPFRRFIRAHVPIRFRRHVTSAQDSLTALLHGRDPYGIKGVTIETSTACNRHCSYCPVSTLPQKQRLIKDETLTSIIAGLRRSTYKGTINFSFYQEP